MQVFGAENLTSYRFNRKFATHLFCKTCGLHVDLAIREPSEDGAKVLNAAQKEFFEYAKTTHPLNLRLLDGVEWNGQRGETGGDDVAGKISRWEKPAAPRSSRLTGTVIVGFLALVIAR